MHTTLQFQPANHQLSGPAGQLNIPATDLMARRFLMLIEGQCLHADVLHIAHKYGYCRQRYYQLLERFKAGGLAALQPQKTGPKTHYRRTDQVVRQVLRYRFLDPEASPEVLVQKLHQTHFAISLRSVQRILADYGLQKKTLPAQPPKPTAAPAHPAPRKTPAPPTGRRPQPGTGGAPAPGR